MNFFQDITQKWLDNSSKTNGYYRLANGLNSGEYRSRTDDLLRARQAL